MTTSLTAPERNFLAHYGWDLLHGMSGPTLKWIGENKLTVMDFRNLVLIYEAEADGSLYAVRPEEGLVIPWTPEELRSRNSELASEAERQSIAPNPLTEAERRFADAYIKEELALVKGPAVTWAVEHGITPLEMAPLLKARGAEPGFVLNLEIPWESVEAFRVRMMELTSEPPEPGGKTDPAVSWTPE